MKNLKIILLSLLMTFVGINIADAQATGIVCSTQVNGQNVTITGQIENANTSNQVTLLVGSPENIIYINQIESSSTGEFSFVFPMSDNISGGSYAFKVGSDADVDPYEGILDYTPTITERNKFIDADVNVEINGYVPIISGTLNCTEGKTIVLTINNITDNTVISSETIKSEDGVFNISHTLPSLVNPKEYEVIVSCTENENQLLSLNVTIDSSIILVDISGQANTAENVDVEAQLQTVNTGLIDKSTTFTGNKSLSFTIPNILSNATFHLTASGYETVIVQPSQPEPEYSICTFGLNENGEVIVLAKGNNITSFKNKSFEITYDEEKVKPVHLYTASAENILAAGIYGNIEILSNEAGKIVFRMSDYEIESGKYWSGIMGIFKFKNISNTQIDTEIQFKPL